MHAKHKWDTLALISRVVMPQVDQVPHRSRKQATLVVGVVAVLVVVLVVTGVLWLRTRSKDTLPQTTAALNSAAGKAFDGNYDGAIALLKQQIAQANTNNEKLMLYMAIGADYEGKKDNAAALDAYRKAGAIQSSYGTNDAIARAADRSGNTSVALDYYQRNRTLIKSGQAPHHRDDLPDIEAAITRLGGKL